MEYDSRRSYSRSPSRSPYYTRSRSPSRSYSYSSRSRRFAFSLVVTRLVIWFYFWHRWLRFKLCSNSRRGKYSYGPKYRSRSRSVSSQARSDLSPRSMSRYAFISFSREICGHLSDWVSHVKYKTPLTTYDRSLCSMCCTYPHISQMS